MSLFYIHLDNTFLEDHVFRIKSIQRGANGTYDVSLENVSRVKNPLVRLEVTWGRSGQFEMRMLQFKEIIGSHFKVVD